MTSVEFDYKLLLQVDWFKTNEWQTSDDGSYISHASQRITILICLIYIGILSKNYRSSVDGLKFCNQQYRVGWSTNYHMRIESISLKTQFFSLTAISFNDRYCLIHEILISLFAFVRDSSMIDSKYIVTNNARA